ncbi:MAG: heparan-alpha-glucosaminide N-acetyltransferase [Candidatus Micrarchaeia archaeon]
MPPDSKRFWELDASRGFAIALMIGYHFVFDLEYFGIMGRISHPLMFWLPRGIGALFLLIFGISLSISYSRNAGLGANAPAIKELNRAAFLGAVAIAITIATTIYPGDGAIVFGIIHLMAVSAALSPAFRRFRTFNLVFGSGLVIAGIAANATMVGTQWLVWLGFAFPGFYTLDYYPLLPWFGVVLIGMFLGKTLYPNAKRAFPAPAQNPGPGMLALAGRNSLAIYLLHQPILVGIIAAYGYFLH